MLPIYAAIASILPVWVLMCPRDYLSSYMKIGVMVVLGGRDHRRPSSAQDARDDAVHLRRRAGDQRSRLAVCLHRHHVRGDLGLSRADRLGHHAEDDRTRNPTSARSATARWWSKGFIAVTALVAACALEPGDYFLINADQNNPALHANYVSDDARRNPAELGFDPQPRQTRNAREGNGGKARQPHRRRGDARGGHGQGVRQRARA